MPVPTNYALQGLMPAKNPGLATAAPVGLPAGGPIGTGGAYAQGQALGLIGGAVANHVFTLTLTKASATGLKGYFVYYGDKVYSGLAVTGGITANSVAAFPTAAQVQAALVAAVPSWNGNVTVTGSDSANYTITFNNLCASKSIGGLLQFVVTANTGGSASTVGAITIATQGSIGAGQYQPYSSGGTPNRVDAFLMNYLVLDPVGAPSIEFGSSKQATSGYPAWTKGYFYADTTNFPGSSVVGLDANAFTITPYKLLFEVGTALTDTGCMIQLL